VVVYVGHLMARCPESVGWVTAIGLIKTTSPRLAIRS
jgi:hypothetical protein